jgi:hypothetical protein
MLFPLILPLGATDFRRRRPPMIQLELTDEEVRILRSVIENYAGHLEVEIHRTEKHEFREALERREKFLHDVIQRLGEQRKIA